MDGGDTTAQEPPLDALPFRLEEIEIKPMFVDFHPLIVKIRIELMFQLKLLRNDWNQRYTIAFFAAVLAVLLGSLNADIFDGGNAKIAGLDGLQEAGSTAYFQMVLSLLCWGWFLYSLIQLFPIMRTHTVTLLLIWSGFGIAHIYFHSYNKNFPISLSLSEMMGGFLITLVLVISVFRLSSFYLLLPQSLYF